MIAFRSYFSPKCFEDWEFFSFRMSTRCRFSAGTCINSQPSRTRAIPEVMEHFSAWSAAQSFPDKLLAISQPLMSSFCLGFRLLSIIITERWQVQTFVSCYWGNCDSALDAVVFNEQVLRLGFFCMVWFCWMFYPLQRHKCKFGCERKYKCALDIILHLKIVESVYSPLNIPHFLFFPYRFSMMSPIRQKTAMILSLELMNSLIKWQSFPRESGTPPYA